MKTLNNDIKAANHSTRNRQNLPGDRSAGFTLIELLTVIGIIAVLIALLLPVMQRKREAVAADKAAENLRALLVASNEYFARTGQYPDKLADLQALSGSNAWTGPVSLIVTTGRAGGYAYDFNDDNDVDGADFLAVAEPEYPGITGGVTLTINANGIITSAITPGSREARERMFANIRARAAETVVNLLKMDSTAITEVRDFTESPATLTTVFNQLDSDDDGRVNATEAFSGDAYLNEMGLKSQLRGFLDYARQEMKWDSLSEADSQSIAVGINELGEFANAAVEPPLISYDGLGRLTGAYALTVGPNINDLIANLEVAEAAEAGGDEPGKARAIQAYQRGVSALIGQSLTRAQANILLVLSKTL